MESRPALYTTAVRQYVHSLPFPKHFIMDTTEVWDQAPYPHVLFILYRDNILTFGEDDLIQITNTINTMMEKLRSEGLPCFVRTLKNRNELDAGA